MRSGDYGKTWVLTQYTCILTFEDIHCIQLGDLYTTGINFIIVNVFHSMPSAWNGSLYFSGKSLEICQEPRHADQFKSGGSLCLGEALTF